MSDASTPPQPDAAATELVAFARGLGATLSADGAARLVNYVDEMLVENQQVNLTAIRERPAALALHAADGLGIAAVMPDAGPADSPELRILDLGTGNGFPGVSIACLFPTAVLTLLDKTQKKIAAIQRILERAAIDPTRVRAVADDASQAHAHGMRRAFDLVVARAVAEPAKVARLAGNLIARGGSLALWLAADEEPPNQLPGGLNRLDHVTYDLPAPADRRRRIALYAAR